MHRLVVLIIAGFTSLNLFGQDAELLLEKSVAFLQTLTDQQTESATYAFDDSARMLWTNLPVGMVPRPGLQYGELSEESRIAFHQILTNVFSSQGYLKLTSIMHLDDILNELYAVEYEEGRIDDETYKFIRGLRWAYENFYVAFFGVPGAEEPWGFSFGGHHVALNLTVYNKQISLAPLFFGSDPAEIKRGKYSGWRVLPKEEDYGFLLLHSLDEEQLQAALLSQETPRDIITNPSGPQRIDSTYGLSAGDMSDVQREILKLVIDEYVHNLEHEYAHEIIERVESSGFENVFFAWIGSQEPGAPHYYIINAPDLLIEYDNYPNSGNHIHVILRQKDGDFGQDLLKEHYLKSEHHRSVKD